MIITRLKRFESYADAMREANAPFTYGQNDGMTFVAHAIERLLGVDKLAPIKPADKRTARRQQFRGLIPLLTSVLGQPAEDGDEMQIADPCVVEIDGVEAAGLWSGTRVTVFRERGGLLNVPADRILAWWKIG